MLIVSYGSERICAFSTPRPRADNKKPCQGQGIQTVTGFKSGEGRIRTDGGLAPTLVFKTRAINHSTTSPERSAPARQVLT